MIFRRAVESDLNAYAAIQSSEWGDEMAADSTQLAHRLGVSLLECWWPNTRVVL